MKAFTLCAAISISMVAASPTEAGLVTVLNPSFEGVQLSDGTWVSGNIPDWAIDPRNTSKIGTYDPDRSKFSVGVPDGENTAYLNVGWIYQDLSATLKVGTYMLRVDVGDRLDTPLPGFNIALRTASDNEDLVSIVDNPVSFSIADGTFETISLLYKATESDARLGEKLRIVLESDGLQTNFDDVRLDYIANPEPSTLAMAASGAVIGLGWYWHRRRTRKFTAIGA